MELQAFRLAIRREFGEGLENATPANIREFLDRMQQTTAARPPGERLELREDKAGYEEILRDFFARVLYFPPDQALMLLWTMAFELAFGNIETDLAERLDPLFGTE